jgi:hypothetical protein
MHRCACDSYKGHKCLRGYEEAVHALRPVRCVSQEVSGNCYSKSATSDRHRTLKRLSKSQLENKRLRWFFRTPGDKSVAQ